MNPGFFRGAVGGIAAGYLTVADLCFVGNAEIKQVACWAIVISVIVLQCWYDLKEKESK